MLATPTEAAESFSPLNFKALYTFGLGGLDIGKMGIEVEQDASHYAATADITLVGLAKMITNHTSHTMVDGSGAHYTYPNRQYDTHYRTKKKPKSVSLVYEHGKIIQEDVQPPDNRATRPEVSDVGKSKGFDPLSFILEMREQALAAAKGGKSGFVLYVFDGRRLTEASFTKIGSKIIRMSGKKMTVQAFAVKRKPVEGFTATEIDDWSPKEPPLYVYFSDDTRFVPVKLEMSMWFGVLSAELTKECRTGESCLLGIKE
jgi:hypothetical protein